MTKDQVVKLWNDMKLRPSENFPATLLCNEKGEIIDMIWNEGEALIKFRDKYSNEYYVPHANVLLLQPDDVVPLTFDGVKEYICQKMAGYTDSRQPSKEDVIIAWLVGYILDKEK